MGLVSEEEADTNALVKFKRDADWPVDSLALLAKAAAHVVCRYHENGGNLQVCCVNRLSCLHHVTRG